MAESKKHNGANLVSEEEAMKVAEGARETTWDKPSFLKEMFLGRLRLDLIDPFPDLKGLDRPEFKEFYEKMKHFLTEEIDSNQIDRDGKISPEAVRKLADMGAFGIKIKKEYGGLELTQAEYNAVLQLVCSTDGNITALLSAHQSIGVPQPLKLFGTDEQKKKYLPRLAKGAVSAFALTETNVGSDPANLATTVVESEDGKSYILNGEKLWCTNGTIAELLVVMARHPEDSAISAFIVETDWEGVRVEHRCHFMGLKALENGVLSFKDVRVPKENLLWERGRGLKLALITLNTGRLSLPACATGAAKACLEVSRRWSKERFQWGQVIGKHEAIAQKIADMAGATLALESVWQLATALAEDGFDIRLEAAVAKMYNTEYAWKIVDETLQIRGGRGYETADSLLARGEEGIAVERAMRDSRINLIFEGSSEIMRLFIAREAVDKHLQVAGKVVNPKSGFGEKMAAFPKIAAFYLFWYPARWFGWALWPRYSKFGPLAKHMRFVNRSTRKLARQVFHGMLVHKARLQYKQAFLGRIVEIGGELFAMAATITRAHKLAGQGNKDAVELADVFCRGAHRRVTQRFSALWSNDDVRMYRLAKKVLEDRYTWLEDGIAGFSTTDSKKQKESVKSTLEPA